MPNIRNKYDDDRIRMASNQKVIARTSSWIGHKLYDF
jgi:hypothetical protein